MQKSVEKNLTANIYGIDISEEALKTATKLNQSGIVNGRLKLNLGRAEALPFPDECFDFVIATQTHIFWDDLGRGLRECRRVLKKPGKLLISTEIAKLNYHLPKYRKFDDFAELLHKLEFEEVKIYSNDRFVAYVAVKSDS